MSIVLEKQDASTPSETIAGSPRISTDIFKEEEGEPPAENTAPPDGGFKAWLQVLGAFFLCLNSWGIVNSFGAFQTYYSTALLSQESPSNISWIGSMQGFLLLMIGVVTGPIYDAGHFQALIRTGSFLVVFGMMMTSLCTQYWQVMLAQGVCIGLGSGCIFVPSFALLPQYFTKRRALATGFAVSGSSVGGIIYPVVFHKLQPRIGFPWATRVIGFLALAGVLVSLGVSRVRVLPKQKRALLELSAFREAPYSMFTIGMFFSFLGLYIPIFYIQTYAIQKGITSQNLGFYLLPILNAASIFGRIIPNFIADKAGALNILVPCCFAASILSFAWIGIDKAPGLIVFAILYGFFSGAFVSLPPTAVVALSPHLGVIGTRMGMCFALASLGLLIGTPVSGAILNRTGDFLGPQALSGAMVLLAGSSILASRIIKHGPKLLLKA